MDGTPRPVFVLRYRSRGGPQLGEGLQERQFELVVDGQNMTATLDYHRSSMDQAGEPIGRFRRPLEPALLERIEAAVRQVQLPALGPSVRGDMGASILDFEVQAGEDTVTKQLTSFDFELLKKLEPLMFELTKLLSELLRQHPVAALLASVKHERQRGEEHFILTLQNVGKQPVRLNDPRTLGRTNDRWAGIRFARRPKEEPGYTSLPPAWRRLLLAKPPKGEPSPGELTLGAGESISLRTEPWKPKAQEATYLVQGVWVDYQALPERKGPYQIRGAVFSEAITVKTPK